jgi:hypothetical protein
MGCRRAAEEVKLVRAIRAVIAPEEVASVLLPPSTM